MASVRLETNYLLICYLDDSGKDPQNAVTTIAGYVARDDDWALFEQSVEPIFKEHSVTTLHAVDLYHGNGDFEGWRILKKQAFVAKLCMCLPRKPCLGVSFSTAKAPYEAAAKVSARKQTVTPYTFCFGAIVDWLLRDIRVGGAVWKEGLRFIIEAGHQNNAEAIISFDRVREKHELDQALRGVSFAPKTDSRAIQMADLLAFYTRRDAREQLKSQNSNQIQKPVDPVLQVIAECPELRTFIATGFDGPIGSLPSWRPSVGGT